MPGKKSHPITLFVVFTLVLSLLNALKFGQGIN